MIFCELLNMFRIKTHIKKIHNLIMRHTLCFLNYGSVSFFL